MTRQRKLAYWPIWNGSSGCFGVATSIVLEHRLNIFEDDVDGLEVAYPNPP
jgi:hypothetical protein